MKNNAIIEAIDEEVEKKISQYNEISDGFASSITLAKEMLKTALPQESLPLPYITLLDSGVISLHWIQYSMSRQISFIFSDTILTVRISEGTGIIKLVDSYLFHQRDLRTWKLTLLQFFLNLTKTD